MLRVAIYNEDEPLSERAFLVVVPSLYDPPSEQVFALEASLHRKYPGVRLDVRLKGTRERGLADHEADLVY